ncbi:arginine decarboxylase [Ruminiclostridium sufflavum DSM 19573]|uniref:Arginine decarboxylase n=1 Tax=Ruminiclostridium sufflavum DSM 19573 TaxID=1121337 RepID=A0A318XMU6_9FIRM|nr:aminotransferase class I/II-fold pyridoxal phosphate-dependent enzyme [Ruminiclostridium sufflavum]PYG89187.1 arginine decarboxylase [Ruminiclostridium sufflavum DSM 19573]
MNTYNTPIYNYLREYAEQDMNIFHMPGHKLSKGIPQELARDILRLDVTEVEGTDNLHYPEGIIKEAEELAAAAFGADRTFFLVNGSTCGIQAAIMSACSRGQKIIVGRDSHKSVAAGLILSGAEPVFAYPEYNCEFGIAGAITSKSIEKLLQEHPDAAAVLVTRPNYYGICSDIEKIACAVHAHNKLLIVDEAHGAHFAFNRRLPSPALQYGADICIQSAHKTLPAVTQGAYLHIKGSRADAERLKFNLSMLQTSSPSYIIMSYLDIARELMVTEGASKLEALISEIELFSRELREYPEYRILSNSMSESNFKGETTCGSAFLQNLNEKAAHDPTRLVINIRKLGISGYYAEKLLRERFKTQVEMADYENLVFITTIADSPDTFSSLLAALKGLRGLAFRGELQGLNLQQSIIEKYYEELQTSAFEKAKAGSLPYEAYMAQKKAIPLKESCGRICADVITPYPPGIPVLYPGEIIEKYHIRYISAVIEGSGKVNGISYNRYIQVIK